MFPNRFVNVPVVEKRFVDVAAVVVPWLAVKEFKVVEPSEVREPDGNMNEPAPKVAPVTLEAAIDPVVFERSIPNDEVASCWKAPPAYEPKSTPAAVGFDIPVPPPPAVNSPAIVLVNVIWFADAVIVVDAVKPLNGDEDVAKVTAGPVCVWPRGPIDVTAEVR